MRYGTRQALLGTVMILIGLPMGFAHKPIISIHGLSPTHAATHGPLDALPVVGCVIFVAIGSVTLVKGLILRRRDPDWRPDR